MWQAGNETDTRVAFSLDAEKAFDRVEWALLFQSLEKFGIGSSFINWVRLLYYNPKASVVTNGRRSPPFQLHRGTRQGRPLSPLIFALVLEPLVIVIRQNNNIWALRLAARSSNCFCTRMIFCYCAGAHQRLYLISSL